MSGSSGSRSTPMLKVVIVGDSGVGKTNILSRYVNNKFILNQNATIGVEFSVKEVSIDGETIKMQIWDTAGQDRYRSLGSIFYKNAVGAMVVFDLGSQKTFDGTTKWVKEIRDHAIEGIVMVLIGNKSDLEEREVTTEQALVLAESQNMAYLEVSAATNNNIVESFDKLSQEIFKKYKNDREKQPPVPPPKPVILEQKFKKEPKGKCCS